MKYVDLNCDLGESFGPYNMGMDEAVIPLITSANIGCGFHGGDPMVMEKTVKLCADYKIAVGAHPGFPDLMGFGRRTMVIAPQEAKAYIKYQLGALNGFCVSYGIKIQHVKPHGALYNMAAKDYTLASAIAQAIYEVDKTIIFLGLSGSEMINAAKDIDLPWASEVFADRAYNMDGTLVSRNIHGAMIHDEKQCSMRIVKMVLENKVTSIDGEEVPILPHSVCVHGDNPKALDFVKGIRQRLETEGIGLVNLGQVLNIK